MEKNETRKGKEGFFLALSLLLMICALSLNTVEMVLMFNFKAIWDITEAVLLVIVFISILGYRDARKRQISGNTK